MSTTLLVTDASNEQFAIYTDDIHAETRRVIVGGLTSADKAVIINDLSRVVKKAETYLVVEPKMLAKLRWHYKLFSRGPQEVDSQIVDHGDLFKCIDVVTGQKQSKELFIRAKTPPRIGHRVSKGELADRVHLLPLQLNTILQIRTNWNEKKYDTADLSGAAIDSITEYFARFDEIDCGDAMDKKAAQKFEAEDAAKTTGRVRLDIFHYDEATSSFKAMDGFVMTDDYENIRSSDFTCALQPESNAKKRVRVVEELEEELRRHKALSKHLQQVVHVDGGVIYILPGMYDGSSASVLTMEDTTVISLRKVEK